MGRRGWSAWQSGLRTQHPSQTAMSDPKGRPGAGMTGPQRLMEPPPEYQAGYPAGVPPPAPYGGYPGGAGAAPYFAPGTQEPAFHFGGQSGYQYGGGYYPPPQQNYSGPYEYGFGPPGGYDEEATAWAAYHEHFQAREVRQDFVRKVLGLVLLQLLVTAGASFAFLYVQPLKLYVQHNQWPFWTAWILSFATIITMGCSERARRTYPWNYLSFAVFTLTFAFLVGTVTSFYDVSVLALALAITAGVVGFVWILATTAGFDFTRTGGFLYIASSAFLLALVVGIFWPNNIYYLIISVVGAVLFSAYLLYDIQLLMGGRSLEISPDDYIFAATQIYLDIVNIFINILQILQLSQNN
ncbi:hypothetical protein WJX81_005654 [Elliptochloris bilobata]|uniref:Uncharacterized protein n=1 Tax=Elliptochloris bilobata TaxID=381761 RepID=A0AAW1S2L8_9CHLO